MASLRARGNKRIKSLLFATGENAMKTTSRITSIAAVIAASIASLAFAQSTDHTGSMMPYYYEGGGGQMRGTWAPEATPTTPGTGHAVTQLRGLYGYAKLPATGHARRQSR